MIIEGILNIIFAILSVFIDLIPSIDIGGEILGALNAFVNLFKQLEYFFPISTFLQCLTVMLGIEATKVIVWVVNWVVHRLPIVG